MILITRGRPKELARFIQAYRDTNAGHAVLMYFDEDDPALPDYKEILYPDHWLRMVGPRKRPGPTYNEIFRLYPNEAFYGMLADDIVPLTQNWDEILVEKAGADGMSWPDDLMWHDEIATHPVIGGDLVRAAGFICYNLLQQYFGDTWWTFVAKKLGVARYCPEVVFDHRHHVNDKAPIDQTYRDKWPYAESDRAIYDAFVNDPNVDQYIEELRNGLVLQRTKADQVSGLRN